MSVTVNALRTIDVTDSDPDDESRFSVLQRVETGDDARLLAFPNDVWLTLDDALDFGRALVDMVTAIREEQVEKPKPAKKAAAKRPTRKRAPAKPKEGETP